MFQRFVQYVTNYKLFFFTSAVLAMLCANSPLMAKDNQNFPGNDYNDFAAENEFLCRKTCYGEEKCRAYTYVKPSASNQGRCWLKNKVAQPVADACCVSWLHFSVQNGVTLARGDMLIAEDKTNRPGLDYRNFQTNAWETCRATCKAEGKCSSWTFVRPGVQEPSGRCWLKNAVARPVPHPGTISGVKFVPASVNFD